MKLILGGINGQYLRNITLTAAKDTEQVYAAVAYANDAALLFDWCWENNIPLRYWERLDESVAVSVPILTNFLKRKSSTFVCKLVQDHHAKVIWWRGVGLYIRSHKKMPLDRIPNFTTQNGPSFVFMDVANVR